jgi:hypothetical protein
MPVRPQVSRRLLMAAVAVLLVTTVAACNDGDTAAQPEGTGAQPEIFESTVPVFPSAPAQLNLKPGTAATVPVDDGTVRVTVRSLKSRTKGCGEVPTPPEQGRFVVAEILIEVVDGEFSFGGGEFQWFADDGTVADLAAFTGCTTSPLQGANGLPAGQKRAGQMVFDVKPAGGVLGFSPDLSGVPIASWRP